MICAGLQYAWSVKAKGPWPAAQSQSYLAMVPPIPGNQADWLRQFMHRDMSSPGLVKLLWENPPPDDPPQGKEIVILTTMTFDLQDHALAAETLRAKGSDFQVVERDSRHAIFD